MILEIVLTSSVLILIIMLLRAFCRKRIKPTLMYALWLVVAVRLVLPFSLFSSNASVMNIFGRAGMVESPAPSVDITPSAPSDIVNDVPKADAPADDYIPTNQSAPDVPPQLEQGYIDPISPADPANQEDISIPAAPSAPINPVEPDSGFAPPIQDYTPEQYVPEYAEASAAPIEHTESEGFQPQTSDDISPYENKQPSLSLSLFGRSIEIQPWVVNAVRAVWLIAAAVMGIWFFGVNIAFSVSLRRNRRELDVNAPLKVYASPSLASPCLFGLFRPAIYVNERAAKNDDSLRFVLAHEYCHYRHGDMFWSILRCILLSVYWFNPLVWAAAYLSKRDCECSCDEAAIKLLGEPLRIDYGRAIVSMIPERMADPRLIGVASTSMSGSKRAVRERVKLIAKKPKNTVIAVVLIIAVLVAAVGCTFTSADNGREKNLPEADIGEDVSDIENQPDKLEDDNTAEPDNPANTSGMKIENYDAQEIHNQKYEGTKPYILPIITENGVEDCMVHVKYDGDKLLGVSEFVPVGNSGLSVLSSGRDHCYFYDSSSQIYYYNVTTGETTALLPESYDGHSRQEFIDYYAEHNEKLRKANGYLPDVSDKTDYYHWLFGAHVSSDGKWIDYLSTKWTENGRISGKTQLWLHNVETGEELICEDLLASVIGDNANFVRLLPDDRLLAVNVEYDGRWVYYIVNILTREANKILFMPSGAYSADLSDKYILIFDGDAHVYDITNSEFHEFLIGIDDYDFGSLSNTKCQGDCLAIAPKQDVAYVIDLAHNKKEKFTPPDARYRISVEEVYEDKAVLRVDHKSSSEVFGHFVVQTEIVPEPVASDAELKLYSRHVEFSDVQFQRFLPETYDLTPIYEILGEEAADKAVSEYYKLDIDERQSIPPLYRLLRDTGITREQLEAYNKTAQNKLSDEVIEALYFPNEAMVCEALVGRYGMFCDGEAYSLQESVNFLMRSLPGSSTVAFLNDIIEYADIKAYGITFKRAEEAHGVIMKYVEALKSGENLADLPATSGFSSPYYNGEISYKTESQAIMPEVCNPNTEEGRSRWEQIQKENAYSTYYLPIKIDGRTVDCEIKTVTAGTGKIAKISYNISYSTLSAPFRIFGEDTRGCYIYEMGGQSIYRFDLATAECTQILSMAESGKLIEDPTHYEHIPRGPDEAGYPLQASPDGKWLLYRSDKWLKEDVSPREEYHTWLYNIETGEEYLFDDIAIYATGYEKQFEYLLSDNKILVSGDDSDGSLCYSVVDIPTKKAEKLLNVPRDMRSFAVSRDYIFYFTDRENTQIEVYGIADGSTHRFRFNKPLGNIYSWDCLGKCIAMRIDGSSDGVMVLNLECDTAVNLIIPDNIEYGSMLFELVSDRLVRVEELGSGSSVNIAVWTGLERQPRDTSLAGRLYGRHVEYTAKEYQKFIPEVYDLTPIYGILGEEKAAAAIADYYSLTCKERQALPPLYRLLHGMGITKEQLKKYNAAAENKLSDDVIEALYLDRTLVSSEAVRVKQALLAESSLFYDGNAYSLNEVISTSLPYNVKAEYFSRVEGYVRENCSDYWIRLVNEVKESYDEIATAANANVGETLYSFEKTAVQGDKTADYRIDVVCTGKDRHQTSTPNDTTVWGEFELRAFDKNGKQTGSVKLYNGSPGNQFGAMGLDTKNISRAFNPIIADNIILFSTPNSQIKEGNSIVTIYGITFSGELFMYEIEDSEDFTYISSNAGAGPIDRVFTNALIASDLYSYIRPNFEGDSPDTRYLHESYGDYDIRQIIFYQIDDENRRIIPKIFVNGYYVADIVDSVISEQKPNAADALYVKTSETEAYVYYIADWLNPSEKSGIYYRKTVMDESGKWHAEGDTMRVKTQADVAKWFVPVADSAEESADISGEPPAVPKESFETPAEQPNPQSTSAANSAESRGIWWYTAVESPPLELYDELKFTKIEVPKGIELVNRLASGKWFAYDRRQSFPDTGINAECVYDPESGEVEKISIPDDFPGWLYGSTDALIGGRYLYYWLSYSDKTEKLTAIDFDELTADVIYSYDWDDYNWLDVYPIDNESYISRLTKLEEADGRTAYSITCELRKTDGTAVPLPGSLYIDNGKNSSGLFPRCFFGDDGVIRALCEERVNKSLRYYICDFSHEGEYLGRTELTGIEDLVAEGRLSSCVKEGEYAYIGNSHLVKLQGGNATRIVTNGKDYSSVFTRDRFVYYYPYRTGFWIYNMDTTALYCLDLQDEIADFDTDDFWCLDVTDIGNGELLIEINKWKNPNEYYILSNY